MSGELAAPTSSFTFVTVFSTIKGIGCLLPQFAHWSLKQPLPGLKMVKSGHFDKVHLAHSRTNNFAKADINALLSGARYERPAQEDRFNSLKQFAIKVELHELNV